jgi:hypothetical protein
LLFRTCAVSDAIVCVDSDQSRWWLETSEFRRGHVSEREVRKSRYRCEYIFLPVGSRFLGSWRRLSCEALIFDCSKTRGISNRPSACYVELAEFRSPSTVLDAQFSQAREGENCVHQYMAAIPGSRTRSFVWRRSETLRREKHP